MDQSLFLRYFLEHQGTLKAYLLVATSAPGDADDLLQDVATLLWKNFDRFDRTRSFLAWALGTARLEALKWRQRQKRLREVLSGDAITDMADTARDCAEEAHRRRAFLHICLDTLGDRARAVIQMRYLENLSVAQIAGRLGQTAGAAAMLLFRTRGLLRECVKRRSVLSEG